MWVTRLLRTKTNFRCGDCAIHPEPRLVHHCVLERDNLVIQRKNPAVGALRNAKFLCVGGRICCTILDYQSSAHNVTGFGGFITTTYECTNGSYAIPCPSHWYQPLPLQRDDQADGTVNT
jgi:hypothetical protein